MNHISKSRMREFCAKSLEVPELAEIVEHMEGCTECKELYHDVFQERTGPFPHSINLSDSWLRYEHLEYEQLVAYVDNKLDEIDREMLDVHLNGCASCREDVRSFVDYRKQVEPFMNVRYAPKEAQTAFSMNWFRGNAWPGFAALAVVVIVGTGIGIFVLRGNGSPHQQSVPAQVSQNSSESPSKVPATVETPINPAIASHPSDQSSNSNVASRPSSNSTHPRHTAEASNSIHLHDGSSNIIIDSSGNISGTETTSPQVNDLVRQILAGGPVKRPAALGILVSESDVLRGSDNNDSSFRLLSPVGVVAGDNPVFAWEPIKNATVYRVMVADLTGHEVAKSPQLPPGATKWTPAGTLKRGGIYTWSVTAEVGGQEITSSSASAPEAKFKVLDDDKHIELVRLRNESNSHLKLGLVYANFGMIDDAEREFQTLANENPHSPFALKLLRVVKSWR